MSFAENLKDLLDSKEIEVKELAHGTGISKNTLDNYLSGQKSIPNAENAVKIAKLLIRKKITQTVIDLIDNRLYCQSRYFRPFRCKNCL